MRLASGNHDERPVVRLRSFRTLAHFARVRNLLFFPQQTNLARTVAVFVLLFVALPARAQEAVATLDPAQTRIEFTLGDVLHTVHGTFRLKSGEIHFDVSTGKAAGKVVVDATSGESGNSSRDKKMHAEYLESQKYPEIVFIPTRVNGSLNPKTASQVEVSGVFQLHGSDHEFTMSATVEPGAGKLDATAKFTIPYVKWGIKNPSTFLLRVSDKVDIEVHAVGKLAPAAPAS